MLGWNRIKMNQPDKKYRRRRTRNDPESNVSLTRHPGIQILHNHDKIVIPFNKSTPLFKQVFVYTFLSSSIHLYMLIMGGHNYITYTSYKAKFKLNTSRHFLINKYWALYLIRWEVWILTFIISEWILTFIISEWWSWGDSLEQTHFTRSKLELNTARISISREKRLPNYSGISSPWSLEVHWNDWK